MDQRRSVTAISVWLTLLAGVILPAGGARRAVAAPPTIAPAAAPQTGSSLARGPVADLNLAFTAQAIGWIEPCG